MNNKKLDAGRVWKQLDDDVVPQLKLSAIDRAVYSFLLRHSRLDGKRRMRFAVSWLAHGVRLGAWATRHSLHRLFDHGALRLIECGQPGHVVHVRLAEEIPGVRMHKISAGDSSVREGSLETTDFLQSRGLREVIHTRERNRCFYCMRRVAQRTRCLDHVVPRAKFGRNSYRNLVSSRPECNSKKAEQPADEFLRWLYRERRLSASDLRVHLRALDDLAAGKLRPVLPAAAISPACKHRPRQVEG